MSNTLQRILAALVLIPIVIGVVYLGGIYLALAVAVVGILAVGEFYHFAEQVGATPMKAVGFVLVPVLCALPWLENWIHLEHVVVSAFLLTLLWSTFSATTNPIRDLGATWLGVFYPGMLLVSILWLRELETLGANGFAITMTVLVGVWSSDTGAYALGRMIGKHPLAPSISPKKTWEGFAGGVLGAAVAILLIRQFGIPSLSWIDAGVLAIICGAIAPLGDLAESRMKRAAGVKDSGTLIPGHGGVLDRIDAVIVAVPLSYLYFEIVGRVAG